MRAAALLLGTAAAGSALGLLAVLYVNVDRLDVVDKKRAVAKTVVTVDRNAQLTVIAKEGRWYKVEVGGQQGYVAETVVSEKPGAAKGKGVSLAAVKGGSIPQLETAAAVKGLGEGTRQYASSNGLRTNGLEELIRRRESVTPSEFDQFLTAGGLGGTTATASLPEDSDPAGARVAASK
jgi:hypothetical protein